MGKIGLVAAKYIVHAHITIEGTVDRPDVIGAVFGQTEGLLGEELELRELQRNGKIGRIEVNLVTKAGKASGDIIIPSSLDKAETAIIGAALETIQRIGPCNAQVKIKQIEDVRTSKRSYVLDRAKELLKEFTDNVLPDSQELTDEVSHSVRAMEIVEYGKERLAAGPYIDESSEIIVVEGRADVLNLLKNGIKNSIALNGTSVPKTIVELCKKKEVTVFVDGDRGGDLIIKEMSSVTEIDYVVKAPDGKEVEELTGKEILQNLRKKVTAEEFLKGKNSKKSFKKSEETSKPLELSNEDTNGLKALSKKIEGTNKAVLLNGQLVELKSVSSKALTGELKRTRNAPAVLVIDGNVTKTLLETAEKKGVQVIVAKNFSATDTTIKLLSL